MAPPLWPRPSGCISDEFDPNGNRTLEQRPHTEDELNGLPDSTRYLPSSDSIPGLSSYSSMLAGSPSMYQRSKDPRTSRMLVPTLSSYQPPLCHFHRRLPIPPQVEALVPAHDHQYFCVYCVLNLNPQAQAPNNSFTTSHSDVPASRIEPPYNINDPRYHPSQYGPPPPPPPPPPPINTMIQPRELVEYGSVVHAINGDVHGYTTVTSVSGQRDESTVSCHECGQNFAGYYARGNYARHFKTMHTDVVYVCKVEECGEEFKRSDYRLKHYRNKHPHLNLASASRRG